jgi:hypothetical protein
MIEHIKKLLADATPPPWHCEGRGSLRMDGSRDYWEVHGPHDGERWAKVCSTCPPAHRNPQNLKLIAAAVNALPALLAVVEAARKRAKVGGHRAGYGCCEASFAKGVKGCPCGLDDIVESLAKLDEVQP